MLCFPSRSGCANIASIGHWTVSHSADATAPLLPFCYAFAIGTTASPSSSRSTTITTVISTTIGNNSTTRSVPREGGSTWILYLLRLTAAMGTRVRVRGFLLGDAHLCVFNNMCYICTLLLISQTCTIRQEGSLSASMVMSHYVSCGEAKTQLLLRECM